MPTDIVFPQNGNEKLFAEQARRLGITHLIFAYRTLNDALAASSQKLPHVRYAVYIDVGTKEMAKKHIMAAEHHGLLSLVLAYSTQFIRFIVEKTPATALVDVEFVHKTDHLHFRRSGLDQVLCRFASQTKKAILISFSHLLTSPDRALILGRVIQNIFFCKKYNIPYAFMSFAHSPLDMKRAYDLRSLTTSFGMSGVSYNLIDKFFADDK